MPLGPDLEVPEMMLWEKESHDIPNLKSGRPMVRAKYRLINQMPVL